MITDRTDILTTLNELERLDSFVPLRNLSEVCPAPDVMIHIYSSDVEDAISRFGEEIARLPERKISGLVCMYMGKLMTMKQLGQMDRMLPQADRFRRNINFDSISGNGVEVFLFCQYQ